MQATDRTVYVGNVGKEVDEAALLALFGHCGTVSAPCFPLSTSGRLMLQQPLMFEPWYNLPAVLQVTQIRIAGDPSYDTRYAFIEFTTVDEVG